MKVSRRAKREIEGRVVVSPFQRNNGRTRDRERVCELLLRETPLGPRLLNFVSNQTVW